MTKIINIGYLKSKLTRNRPQCPKCKSSSTEKIKSDLSVGEVFGIGILNFLEPILSWIPIFSHYMNEDEKRFRCRDCGYVWNDVWSLPDKRTEYVCSRCDNSVSSELKECPNCGKQLTEVMVRKR